MSNAPFLVCRHSVDVGICVEFFECHVSYFHRAVVASSIDSKFHDTVIKKCLFTYVKNKSNDRVFKRRVDFGTMVDDFGHHVTGLWSGVVIDCGTFVSLKSVLAHVVFMAQLFRKNGVVAF